MNQLIEKIKELQNIFKFHCSQVTCEQILGMIEDQESNPFNPLEVGFSIRYNKEAQEEEIFLEKHQVFYIIEKMNTPNHFLLKTLMKHSFSRKTHLNESVNYIPFKAPNHRQGIELLRNLGVIE